MAQPGHPVFLDVLGRIMKDIEKGRAVIEDEAKDDPSPGKANKYISQERLFDIVSSVVIPLDAQNPRYSPCP